MLKFTNKKTRSTFCRRLHPVDEGRIEFIPALLKVPDSDERSFMKRYDFLARDPTYLLRLCQRSTENSSKKWSHIERCCEMISNISDDSEEDNALRSNARQQLLQTDMWGNTPLHVVCYYRPTVSVVETMIRTSQCALGSVEIRTRTNCKGETPLLISCKSSACQGVIQTLLKDGGVAVAMHDGNGSSGFSALVQRYSLVQRIPLIQSRFVDLEDIFDKKELVLTYNAAEAATASTINRLVSMEKLFTDWVTFDAAATDESVFPYFWSLMENLLYAAWSTHHLYSLESGKNKYEYISHLHGAAFVAEALPTDVSDMILRTHEANLTKSALRPLHLSLTKQISSHPKARQNHAHLVKRLVEMDPSAVNTIFPGRRNRSVFCQAVFMGHYWNVDANSEGPVLTLFRQCPDAVSRPDKETGLLPFMIAATVEQAHSKDKKRSDGCSRLDTIYNLLRVAPDCVRRQSN